VRHTVAHGAALHMLVCFKVDTSALLCVDAMAAMKAMSCVYSGRQGFPFKPWCGHAQSVLFDVTRYFLAPRARVSVRAKSVFALQSSVIAILLSCAHTVCFGQNIE
jgi:hypothetical protein